ncbi:hypothetical protein ACIOEX_04810 [Streptomyces sp. NPDC087850]|uniref:hypothetical protein n=1 Tax=unclassified Streptomyces TaxID=2593676 RepID=UPI00382C3ED1
MSPSESRMAAVRKCQLLWRTIKTQRVAGRRQCAGPGPTVMVTSTGPVTIPCLRCGAGAP